MRYIKILTFLVVLFSIITIPAFSQKSLEVDSAKLKIKLGGFTNLHKVNNSIYRSEQPASIGFDSLNKLGVQSILNLRNDSGDNTYVGENKFVLYHVPMSFDRPLDDGTVVNALRTIYYAPKPMLVHCQAGADRTGIIVAMYRVIFEGWDTVTARKEMESDSFNCHKIEFFFNYLRSVNVQAIKDSLKTDFSISQVNLNNKVFDSAVEISSIVGYNNLLYLPKEKCKKILVLNAKDKRLVNTIDLDRGILAGKDVGIEGSCLWKKQLLLTDEANAKIYNYNLSNESIEEVKTDYDLSNDINDHGMEGIAVDDSSKICYALQEKNGNNQSIIHVFKMRKAGDTLHFIRNIIIQQSNDSWRYSDLYYNNKDHYLYCLKSTFGTYQIDTISTRFENTGDFTVQQEKQKLFIDVSNAVNNFGMQGYNTNMEGITVYNNQIFLISDNMQQTSANCNIPGEGKTLLMSVKLANN